VLDVSGAKHLISDPSQADQVPSRGEFDARVQCVRRYRLTGGRACFRPRAARMQRVAIRRSSSRPPPRTSSSGRGAVDHPVDSHRKRHRLRKAQRRASGGRAMMPNPWVIGLMVRQLFSIAGPSGRTEVSCGSPSSTTTCGTAGTWRARRSSPRIEAWIATLESSARRRQDLQRQAADQRFTAGDRLIPSPNDQNR
jgi:hypothetical protein